eukprot:sb/3474114/
MRDGPPDTSPQEGPEVNHPPQVQPGIQGTINRYTETEGKVEVVLSELELVEIFVALEQVLNSYKEPVKYQWYIEDAVDRCEDQDRLGDTGATGLENDIMGIIGFGFQRYSVHRAHTADQYHKHGYYKGNCVANEVDNGVPWF